MLCRSHAAAGHRVEVRCLGDRRIAEGGLRQKGFRFTYTIGAGARIGLEPVQGVSAISPGRSSTAITRPQPSAPPRRPGWRERGPSSARDTAWAPCRFGSAPSSDSGLRRRFSATVWSPSATPRGGTGGGRAARRAQGRDDSQRRAISGCRAATRSSRGPGSRSSAWAARRAKNFGRLSVQWPSRARQCPISACGSSATARKRRRCDNCARNWSSDPSCGYAVSAATSGTGCARRMCSCCRRQRGLPIVDARSDGGRSPCDRDRRRRAAGAGRAVGCGQHLFRRAASTDSRARSSTSPTAGTNSRRLANARRVVIAAHFTPDRMAGDYLCALPRLPARKRRRRAP